MGKIVASQRPQFAVGDVRNCGASFAEQLDSSETLTGTPTVVEVTTTDLTISNVTVNTSTLTFHGDTIAIGEAIQFKVAGQKSTHTPYTLKITTTTSSTPVQTLIRYVKFDVITP